VLFARRLFASSPFERAMLIFGMDSGVFLIGLLLLKVCDPDFMSPAMRDGSLVYSMNTVFGFVLIPFIVGAAVQSGPTTIAGIGMVSLFMAIVGMVIATREYGAGLTSQR